MCQTRSRRCRECWHGTGFAISCRRHITFFNGIVKGRGETRLCPLRFNGCRVDVTMGDGDEQKIECESVYPIRSFSKGQSCVDGWQRERERAGHKTSFVKRKVCVTGKISFVFQ